MPFVKGRYYMNRVLGEALEGAREAEEEKERGKQSVEHEQHKAKGPIQRLEIETAEMVPSHSGRAECGYVARVHRRPAAPQAGNKAEDEFAADLNEYAHENTRANRLANPETHVFNNHDELVNFLRDELGKDQDGQ